MAKNIHFCDTNYSYDTKYNFFAKYTYIYFSVCCKIKYTVEKDLILFAALKSREGVIMDTSGPANMNARKTDVFYHNLLI